MRRTVWSSDKFDRKLAILFEEFEGREGELQRRLSEVIKGLMDGSLEAVRRHESSGDVGCVSLIGDHVIVFSRHLGPYDASLDYIDIAETDHLDLLNIERELAPPKLGGKGEERTSDPRYMHGQRLLVDAMKYLAQSDPVGNRPAIELISHHVRTRFRTKESPPA